MFTYITTFFSEGGQVDDIYVRGTGETLLEESASAPNDRFPKLHYFLFGE